MNPAVGPGWVAVDAADVDLPGFGRTRIEPFQIGRWPVTEAQFDEFLDADDGYGKAKWWKGIPDGRKSPPEGSLGRSDFPRVSVSWYDCVVYGRWDSERSGKLTRLPTEWEWVAAVRQNSVGKYPCGDHFDPAKYNTKEGGIGAVASLARPTVCASAIVDTCGNVWERCLGEHGNPAMVAAASTANRVIRGGSWFFSRREAIAHHRQVCVSSRRFDDGGFRIIRTEESREPTLIEVEPATEGAGL